MPQTSEEKFARLREDMVLNQLEARNITDEAVLNAMRKVPRHLFVPKDSIDQAYADQAIPVDAGSTISQPYIVAFMLEALRVTSHDKVLEIGTGSGYQSAILCELAQKVYSMDINEGLVAPATQRLSDLGYRNFFPRCGNGYEGWQRRAPFDAIIVAAACESLPRDLVKQMAPYGRMIFPLEGDPQYLILLERTDSEILTKELCPVSFVPMQSGKLSGNH